MLEEHRNYNGQISQSHGYDGGWNGEGSHQPDEHLNQRNFYAPPQGQMQLNMRPQSAKVNSMNAPQQQMPQNMTGMPQMAMGYNNQLGFSPSYQFIPQPGFAYPQQVQYSQQQPQNYPTIGDQPNKRPFSAVTGRKGKGGVLNNLFKGNQKYELPNFDVSKTRPKLIIHDKERLYDDAINLKMQMNLVKDDNTKLRTKLQFYETELGKRDRIIDELYAAQNGPNKSSKGKIESSHLVTGLKRQLKDQKLKIIDLEDELGVLKKNIKSTKLQETEVELKMYLDECTRLKHMIEDLLRQKGSIHDQNEIAGLEEQFYQQNILLKNIKKENSELALAYQKKDEENKKWREVAQELEKKATKAAKGTKENKKNKRVLKEKEREIEVLKQELSVSKFDTKEQTQVQRKMEELNQKIINLQNENNQKNDRIEEAYKDKFNKQKEVEEQKATAQKLQEKLQEKINENLELAAKLQQIEENGNNNRGNNSKPINESQQRVSPPAQAPPPQKSQSQIVPPPIKKEHERSADIKDSFSVEPANINTGLQSVEDRADETEKMMQVVTAKELEEEAVELKLKLQVAKIASGDIVDYLFKDFSTQDKITYMDLISIFGKVGYQENKAELIARFLIQKPQGDDTLVIIKQDDSATKNTIDNKLRKLIGYYRLYNSVDEKNMINSIRELCESSRITLQESFQLNDNSDSGFLNRRDLFEAFENIEIPLDKKLQDFILFYLYRKSHNVNQLPYSSIIKMLDDDEYEEEEAQVMNYLNKKAVEEPKKKADSKIYKEKSSEKHDITEDYGDDNFEGDDRDRSKQSTMKIKDIHEEDPNIKDEEEDDEPYQKENEEEHENREENNQEDEEVEYIDDNQMLDIAEQAFFKIAQQMIAANATLRDLYGERIYIEEINENQIELLRPEDFLYGLKDLGIEEMGEIEVACLMQVLAKSQLDHAIVFEELEIIMSNFNIGEPVREEDEEQLEDDEKSIELKKVESPIQEQQPPPPQQKSKKKNHMNFDILDRKALKILLKLSEYLKEKGQAIHDLFGPIIYHQLVKTKTKQDTVELINSNEFFDTLHKAGIKKNSQPLENLMRFLCLDANYVDRLLVKKIKRALVELSKNEELQALAKYKVKSIGGNRPKTSHGRKDGNGPASSSAPKLPAQEEIKVQHHSQSQQPQIQGYEKLGTIEEEKGFETPSTGFRTHDSTKAKMMKEIGSEQQKQQEDAKIIIQPSKRVEVAEEEDEDEYIDEDFEQSLNKKKEEDDDVYEEIDEEF